MAIVDELDDAAPAKQNVVVCVRVRPPASKSEAEQLWALNTAEHRLTPTEQHPSLAKRVGSSAPQPGGIGASASSCDLEGSAAAYDFRFDSLVGPDDSTDGMYAAHISPLVRAAVQGYNGTVFAYGQTGSGKTHTMSGSATEKGVIDRAVEEVWTGVREVSAAGSCSSSAGADEAQDPSREFLLRVSYLEIYNETLRDLLAPLPASQDATDVGGRPASPTKGGNTPSAAQGVLRIMETPGRVQVVGLREDIVTSPSGVLALLAAGQAQRAQAATDWNERSSRSHCVFTITIESRARDSEGKEVRISQLNLIDLAGSERAASEAERRKEGAFVSLSSGRRWSDER
jgi:centromeric protein E